MAYRFQVSPVASLRIEQFQGTDGNNLTLNGINGSLSSADSLVAGVRQFLGIVGLENSFNPTKVYRVVTESVVNES